MEATNLLSRCTVTRKRTGAEASCCDSQQNTCHGLYLPSKARATVALSPPLGVVEQWTYPPPFAQPLQQTLTSTMRAGYLTVFYACNACQHYSSCCHSALTPDSRNAFTLVCILQQGGEVTRSAQPRALLYRQRSRCAVEPVGTPEEERTNYLQQVALPDCRCAAACAGSPCPAEVGAPCTGGVAARACAVPGVAARLCWGAARMATACSRQAHNKYRQGHTCAQTSQTLTACCRVRLDAKA